VGARAGGVHGVGERAAGAAVEARAKAHFGVTHDIARAGYLTPDGSLLDFGRCRERIGEGGGKEHTWIGQVLPELSPEEVGEGAIINTALGLGMARIAVEGRAISVEMVRPLTVTQMPAPGGGGVLLLRGGGRGRAQRGGLLGWRCSGGRGGGDSGSWPGDGGERGDSGGARGGIGRGGGERGEIGGSGG